MTTKAEQFRYDTERSKPKRPPKPVKPKHRRPTQDAGARNLSAHGARKGTVVTEESDSGRPSRKSTRASANHGKDSTVLEYVARMKSQTPEKRHARR